MASTHHITPISQSTGEFIAALSYFSDITDCVDVVIQNAIQSGATAIKILKPSNDLSFTVIDNGSGIAINTLMYLGSSPCTTSSHGDRLGRGLSLYKLARIARLHFTSIPPQTSHAISRVVELNGRAYFTPEKVCDNHFEGQRTSIAVSQLFENCYCRLKFEHAHMAPHQAMFTKICMNYALANPYVSFILEIGDCKVSYMAHTPCIDAHFDRLSSIYSDYISGSEQWTRIEHNMIVNQHYHFQFKCLLLNPTENQKVAVRFTSLNGYPSRSPQLSMILNKFCSFKRFNWMNPNSLPEKPSFAIWIVASEELFQISRSNSSKDWQIKFYHFNEIEKCIGELFSRLFVNSCPQLTDQCDFRTYTTSPPLDADVRLNNPASQLMRETLDKSVLELWNGRRVQSRTWANKPAVERCAARSWQTLLNVPKKSDLEEIVNVLQIDKKILLAVGKDGSLYAFDQHAIHERIRFESILQWARIPSNHGSKPSNTIINLNHSEFHLLQSFKLELAAWGWKYRMEFDSGSSGMEIAASSTTSLKSPITSIIIESIPLLFGQELSINHMLQFVEQLHSLNGKSVSRDPCLTVIPEYILNRVKSKACRGAVMFGDEVDKETALTMFRQLQSCSFPFICAHGRPNIAPLGYAMDYKQSSTTKVLYDSRLDERGKSSKAAGKTTLPSSTPKSNQGPKASHGIKLDSSHFTPKSISVKGGFSTDTLLVADKAPARRFMRSRRVMTQTLSSLPRSKEDPISTAPSHLLDPDNLALDPRKPLWQNVSSYHVFLDYKNSQRPTVFSPAQEARQTQQFTEAKDDDSSDAETLPQKKRPKLRTKLFQSHFKLGNGNGSDLKGKDIEHRTGPIRPDVPSKSNTNMQSDFEPSIEFDLYSDGDDTPSNSKKRKTRSSLNKSNFSPLSVSMLEEYPEFSTHDTPNKTPSNIFTPAVARRTEKLKWKPDPQVEQHLEEFMKQLESLESKWPAATQVDHRWRPAVNFHAIATSDGATFETYYPRAIPQGFPVKVDNHPSDPSFFPKLEEAPVFYPTEEQWKNPNKFIELIQHIAEPYGICKIVPPSCWDRDVWKRCIEPATAQFPTKTVSIHKLHRRKNPYTSFITILAKFWEQRQHEMPKSKWFDAVPVVHGIPIDLYLLYSIVQELGGIRAVDSQCMWIQVAKYMHVEPVAGMKDSLKSLYSKWIRPYVDTTLSNSSIELFPHLTTGTKNPFSSAVDEEGEVHLDKIYGANPNAAPVHPAFQKWKERLSKSYKIESDPINNWQQLSSKSTSIAKRLYEAEDPHNAPPPLSWRSLGDSSFAPTSKDQFVTCYYCRRGDKETSLVICDTPDCLSGAHLKCMHPPLSQLPNGDYFCPGCTDSSQEGTEGLFTDGYGPGKTYTMWNFAEKAINFSRHWCSNPHLARKVETYKKSNQTPPKRTENQIKSENSTSHFTKTQLEFFKMVDEPLMLPPYELEREYWGLVSNPNRMVTVEYGSDVDVTSRDIQSGFPVSNQTKSIQIGAQVPHIGRPGPESENDYMTKSAWNLNNLPLRTLLGNLNESVAGITRPMMYYGMLFSSFCWHTEDNWLHSVNYVHVGAPKRWYGVSSYDASFFEAALKAELPGLFERNPKLLYELVTTLNPEILHLKHRVPMCTTLQNPGEFVVTFPRAYHSGFNLGFNIAESVNFTCWPWLNYGIRAVASYRFVRSSIACHESILADIAAKASTIDSLPTLIVARAQWSQFLLTTVNSLKKLYHAGIYIPSAFFRPSRGQTDSKYHHFVEPQCYVCGYDIEIVGIACGCKNPAITLCFAHAPRNVCPCRMHQKYVYYSKSYIEMTRLLTCLEDALAMHGLVEPAKHRQL